MLLECWRYSRCVERIAGLLCCSSTTLKKKKKRFSAYVYTFLAASRRFVLIANGTLTEGASLKKKKETLAPGTDAPFSSCRWCHPRGAEVCCRLSSVLLLQPVRLHGHWYQPHGLWDQSDPGLPPAPVHTALYSPFPTPQFSVYFSHCVLGIVEWLKSTQK